MLCPPTFISGQDNSTGSAHGYLQYGCELYWWQKWNKKGRLRIKADLISVVGWLNANEQLTQSGPKLIETG